MSIHRMLRSNPNLSRYTACVHVQVIFPEYWRFADNSIPTVNKDALVDLAAILSRFERLSDLTLAVEYSSKDSDGSVSEVCDYVASQFRQVGYLGYSVHGERRITPDDDDEDILSICPSSACELSSDMSDAMSDDMSDTTSDSLADGLPHGHRSLYSTADIRHSLLRTDLKELTAKCLRISTHVVPATQTEYNKETATIIPASSQGEQTVLFPGERAGIVRRQKRVGCCSLAEFGSLGRQVKHDNEPHKGEDGGVFGSQLGTNAQDPEPVGDSVPGRYFHDNKVNREYSENEAVDTIALNDFQSLRAEREEEQVENMNLEPTAVSRFKPRDDIDIKSGAELLTLEGADSPSTEILAQASSIDEIDGGSFEGASTGLQDHYQDDTPNKQLVERAELERGASYYAEPGSDHEKMSDNSAAESTESVPFTVVVRKKNRRKNVRGNGIIVFPIGTSETETSATDDTADKPQGPAVLYPLPVFSEKKYDSWADELDDEEDSTFEEHEYKDKGAEPSRLAHSNTTEYSSPLYRRPDREYSFQTSRSPADTPNRWESGSWRKKPAPPAEKQFQSRSSEKSIQRYLAAPKIRVAEAITRLSNNEALLSGSLDAASNKTESSESQQLS